MKKRNPGLTATIDRLGDGLLYKGMMDVTAKSGKITLGVKHSIVNRYAITNAVLRYQDGESQWEEDIGGLYD